MRTVGALLRERRLEKGIAVQRIAQETMVAQKYLYALENSQHDIFPGHSYLIGYLRVYADYLGFNGNEIIARFRNEILQEQPVPVEELLVPNKKPWLLLSVFGLLGIAIIGALGYFGYQNYEKVLAFFEPSAREEQEDSYTDILVGERIIEQSYTQGSTLQVAVEDQLFRFAILMQDSMVSLLHEAKEIVLSQKEVQLIDFNDDGDYELSAFVRSIDDTGSAAVIRFSRSVGPSALLLPQNNSVTLDDLKTAEFQLEGELMESTEIASFNQQLTATTIDLRMQAPSYVRLRSEEARREQLVETGEQVSFTFQDFAYISLTNGFAVELIVNNLQYPLKEGSNSIALHWVFDDTALMYQLVLSQLR